MTENECSRKAGYECHITHRETELTELSLPQVIDIVEGSSTEEPPAAPKDMEETPARPLLRPEAPVDSMLKDMATIILSTFLLVGWVAFIITYPMVMLTWRDVLLSVGSIRNIVEPRNDTGVCGTLQGFFPLHTCALGSKGTSLT